MKARPITKVKRAYSIDIEVEQALIKKAKKMKLKKSYIVNRILGQELLGKYFETASELNKIKQDRSNTGK